MELQIICNNLAYGGRAYGIKLGILFSSAMLNLLKENGGLLEDEIGMVFL